MSGTNRKKRGVAAEASDDAAAAARLAPLPFTGEGLAGDHLAAVREVNAALMNGFHEVGQEFAAQARQAVEETLRTTRAMLSVRSVADLLAVNREL
ncbi:MAG: phasin family protein, partial [Alphaproteobacteria bacterium]|nr:phasin family protein [Alphaproteobacteria bacterium]